MGSVGKGWSSTRIVTAGLVLADVLALAKVGEGQYGSF